MMLEAQQQSTPRGGGYSTRNRESKEEHPGDRRCRVQVPLPSTLDEINMHATRKFKATPALSSAEKGQMKMWHAGKYRIERDDDLKDLRNGDVVVVDRETYDRFQNSGKLPFDGTSCYRTDYIKHAQKQKTRTAKPSRGTGEALHFDGVSTYQLDFKGHTPRTKTGSAKPMDTAGQGPVAFEGTSTYALDFKGHQTPRRAQSAKPLASKGNPLPFEGRTEYGEHYIYNKAASSKKYIYLEPERR